MCSVPKKSCVSKQSRQEEVNLLIIWPEIQALLSVVCDCKQNITKRKMAGSWSNCNTDQCFDGLLAKERTIGKLNKTKYSIGQTLNLAACPDWSQWSCSLFNQDQFKNLLDSY